MSSFYGGKQGRTYHIVERFDSVQQMVAEFIKGGSYTTVNYGQYVLIDTPDKSSSQNGLLFRREFNFSENYNSNKPGPAPKKITYTGSDSFDEDYQAALTAWRASWLAWVKNVGGGAKYVGQIVGPQGETPQIQLTEWNDSIEPTDTVKGSFSLGKYGENNYNDEIRVANVAIKDEQENILGAEIAFDIPTTVFEADVDNNPYDLARVERVEDDVIYEKTSDQQIIQGKDYYQLVDDVYQLVDSAEQANISNYYEKQVIDHPFYYKWKFYLPSGKHGKSIKQIKIEQGSAIQPVGQDERQKDYFDNDIIDDDYYYTYTSIDYTANGDGVETEHCGRWPYRVIKSIIGNTQPIETNQIRNYYDSSSWNSSMTVAQGQLYYNEYEKTSDQQIIEGKNYYQLVNNVYQLANPAEETNISNYYEKKDNFAVCIQGGEVEVTSTPSTIKGVITKTGASKWIGLGNDIILDLPPISYLDINYTANYENFNNPDKIDIRNLDYLFVDSNGDMYACYVEGSSSSIVHLTNIHTVKNITLENQNNIKKLDGQRFKVVYSDDSSSYVSGPINLPLAIDRQGDNLLILYSDPNVRSNLDPNKTVTKAWIDPVTNTSYTSLDWYNFGPLGAQYHVAGNYTIKDLTTGDLKDGFEHFAGHEDKAGWIVSVYDQQDDSYTFYAFDYNENLASPTHTINNTLTHWYEVSNLAASVFDPTLVYHLSNQTDNVKENGFQFNLTTGHSHQD